MTCYDKNEAKRKGTQQKRSQEQQENERLAKIPNETNRGREEDFRN